MKCLARLVCILVRSIENLSVLLCNVNVPFFRNNFDKWLSKTFGRLRTKQRGRECEGSRASGKKRWLHCHNTPSPVSLQSCWNWSVAFSTPGGHVNHPAVIPGMLYLSAFRDIAKVESVCRHLRARLGEGRVWKALAERLTLRCCFIICDIITKFDQLFFLSSYH